MTVTGHTSGNPVSCHFLAIWITCDILNMQDRLSICNLRVFENEVLGSNSNEARGWIATLPLGDINTEAWSTGMGLGVGLTTLPCKKENCREVSTKFSRILWRRPRPKLGCGAEERRRRRLCGE
jgi:hypothetical protein